MFLQEGLNNAIIASSSSDAHEFKIHLANATLIWDVEDLWEFTKDYQPINVPVTAFKHYVDNVSSKYTEADYKRVENADLSYPPIVLNKHNLIPLDGTELVAQLIIADGVHRSVKYLRENSDSATMPVILLDCLPKPKEIVGGEAEEVKSVLSVLCVKEF